VKTPKKWT